jgi:hypothetical protein
MRDTIDMARESQMPFYWQSGEIAHLEQLKAFEALVRDDYSNKHAQLWLKRIDEAVKAEREACAKLCDDIDDSHWGCEVKASWCSREIRARGETK